MKIFNKRESWKSRIGFMSAALGSAVGLGSIWRFPYVVGQNGGAAFIFLYVFFLVIIGFPILVSEIVIGRTAKSSPYGAFKDLSKSRLFGFFGKVTIFTGFIISSFYSVIAGWTLGYLVEALFNNLNFSSTSSALFHFDKLSSSSFFSLGYHFIFMILSTFILFFGVRNGIESKSKILMPMLFIVLIILVIKGLSLPNSFEGIKFLLYPNFKLLTAEGILIALGQAFFTLSLGQGTMVTYGSYLSKDENIPNSCFPVVVLNSIIALLMGVAIFTTIFSANLKPTAGPSLIFETLPIVFSGMKFGYFIAILFFLLTAIAAITSQISAMEPLIAYFIDEKSFSRRKASITTGVLAFLFGIPSALSFGLLKDYKIFNANFFEIVSYVSVNILVPLGGLFAVILIGYKWKVKNAFEHLNVKNESFFHHRPFLAFYFYACIKYISPVLIILILLNLLGIF